MNKTTSSRNGTTYTTQASGILLTSDGDVNIESGGASIGMYNYTNNITGGNVYSYIGLFQKGAKVSIGEDSHAHIFEFI